jgi:8-oxo-dGTP pyrophosphatase MutT (NUDIX family)
MRWTVHGERAIYESEWIRLALADIEIPGGPRFEHHVIRAPQKAAGVVVHDPDRGVLLLWRHRFITDTWGWEIPAGRIDAGETPAEAAAREVLEETGWRPGQLTHLHDYHPSNGISDQTFHLYAAAGAHYVGEPTDTSESERIEWLPVADLRERVRLGEMTDGLSLTAVLFALTFGPLGRSESGSLP